jgi:hypothetical protein
LNKPLCTKCLVSQAVVEGFGELLTGRISNSPTAADGSSLLSLRRLGAFSLPGKADPVTLYELTGCPKELRFGELFETALAAFEGRHWQESVKMLQEILSISPNDMPSQCLLFSCREYLKNHPPSGEPAIVRVREFAQMGKM